MELQNVLHKPSFKHVSNDACLENGTVECASRPSCYHVGYVIVCIANHLNIQTVKPLLVTGMVIYFDFMHNFPTDLHVLTKALEIVSE